jgi:glucose-6-phosphate-specific signal transduction histidine kinase
VTCNITDFDDFKYKAIMSIGYISQSLIYNGIVYLFNDFLVNNTYYLLAQHLSHAIDTRTVICCNSYTAYNNDGYNISMTSLNS